ncbi:hypothetical protein LINPERHAP2_LOCUS21999 [Linum perenne]
MFTVRQIMSQIFLPTRAMSSIWALLCLTFLLILFRIGFAMIWLA